ncbi:hypothetical protein AX16_007403 [Volvariella volvacea WC 439]|nr:hypothetical protein AX16_007403 [Volvariella volvacea WC 439]
MPPQYKSRSKAAMPPTPSPAAMSVKRPKAVKIEPSNTPVNNKDGVFKRPSKVLQPVVEHPALASQWPRGRPKKQKPIIIDSDSDSEGSRVDDDSSSIPEHPVLTGEFVTPPSHSALSGLDKAPRQNPTLHLSKAHRKTAKSPPLKRYKVEKPPTSKAKSAELTIKVKSSPPSTTKSNSSSGSQIPVVGVDESGLGSLIEIQEKKAKRSPSEEKDAIPAKAKAEDNANANGDDDNINNEKILHKDLVAIYGEYPVVPKVVPLEIYMPYKSKEESPDLYDNHTAYRKVISGMNKETKACILAGLAMTNEGGYMNFGHIPLSSLKACTYSSKNSNRVISFDKDKTKPIPGIMLGEVTYCSVVRGGVSEDGLHQRQISILPFFCDLQLNVRAWAGVFGMSQVIVNPEGLGLIFQSFKETSADGDLAKNINRASAHNKKEADAVDSRPVYSSRFKANIKKTTSYRVTKSYCDPIPIYDGRASEGTPFGFTKKDFANLSNWKTYPSGQDLPANSLVAVGYTANT